MLFIHERKGTPPLDRPGYTVKRDAAGIQTVYKVVTHGEQLYWCAIGQFEPRDGTGYLITLYEPYGQYIVIFRAEAEVTLIHLWEEGNPMDTWTYMVMDKYE